MVDCNNTADTGSIDDELLSQSDCNAGESNPSVTIVLFAIFIVLMFLLPVFFELSKRLRTPATAPLTPAVSVQTEDMELCAAKIESHMSRFTMVLEQKHFNNEDNNSSHSNRTLTNSSMSEDMEEGLPSKMISSSDGNASKCIDATHFVMKCKKRSLLKRKESGFMFIELQNESIPPSEIKQRQMSECCTICINPYRIGDTIAWSSNPLCTHVFHRKCIKSWILNKQAHLQCPCCRQKFVDSAAMDLEQGST